MEKVAPSYSRQDLKNRSNILKFCILTIKIYPVAPKLYNTAPKSLTGFIFIKFLQGRTQFFIQLNIFHKKISPHYLNNLVVQIGKKLAPGDHKSYDVKSFQLLTNLILINYVNIPELAMDNHPAP